MLYHVVSCDIKRRQVKDVNSHPAMTRHRETTRYKYSCLLYVDILQCMEYGPEDFCPTGWYRHVFCRRGMDRADLTVSETSPQVEVEERRSRELVATARRRASARARTDGAVTTAPSRSARAGARATARAWRRASASASTAGAARCARRLSARPTARATAGARAPESASAARGGLAPHASSLLALRTHRCPKGPPSQAACMDGASRCRMA